MPAANSSVVVVRPLSGHIMIGCVPMVGLAKDGGKDDLNKEAAILCRLNSNNYMESRKNGLALGPLFLFYQFM